MKKEYKILKTSSANLLLWNSLKRATQIETSWILDFVYLLQGLHANLAFLQSQLLGI